ncbi:MAG: hypothetical protein ABSE54_10810 [Smithella sp.]
MIIFLAGKSRKAFTKCLSAALRSVRVAATYEKVGLTPRYSRALHLSIFEQPRNRENIFNIGN